MNPVLIETLTSNSDKMSELGTKFYTVVKDTQSECGQPHHRFQKSPFWSIYTETLPQSFQTKAGSAAYLKVSIFDPENAGAV